MNITGKIVVARGSDPFTVREMRELLTGRSWEQIISRLDLLVEGERKTLESADSVDELRRAQGAIAALRRVRDLPQHIIEQMQGKKD